MTIYILRLTNKENIIGDLVTETDQIYTVDNPMLITERWTGDGRALILDTYNVYAAHTHVDISKQQVVTAFAASEEMTKYYVASLQLNREVNDPSFSESIGRATTYLYETLERYKNGENADEPEKDDEDNVIDLFARMRTNFNNGNDSLN
jgi:hypothetical protein